MKSIIIIGAGAAGLMTAATILESDASGYHIHIFEKNPAPGKKILLSGGGRCNVTTALEDKKILATKYTRGWAFIRKAMGKFSPRKCREWFEAHGVALKVEDHFRVFPCSDSGRDIVRIFEDIFAKNRDKISVHFGEGVLQVGKQDSNYTIVTEKGSYASDILVITTGGNAYSHTGSSGDGYAFARALGHRVTELGPSLSSFLTSEAWLHALSGGIFEDAAIVISVKSGIGSSDKDCTSSEQGRAIGELSGSLLLTHFGISGPLAFMISSHLAWEKIGKGHEKTLSLKPLASLGEKEWDEYLKKSFAEHPKKLISSILADKLPRRFVDAFVSQYFPQIIHTFVVSISRTERERIASLLGHGIPITLLERRPGDEFVTAGGVSTDEIDPDTMESSIQKHLYFAGEVLNVDGYTGGFSLQICWASGYAAGKDIFTSL